MTRHRYRGTGDPTVDLAALVIVGAVVVVGGVVVGVGVGCYYAGKGAWWLGKKGVEAASDAKEKRDNNKSQKQLNKARDNAKKWEENKDAKDERKVAKGKALYSAPKISPSFADASAEDLLKVCGVFTLRFGSCNGLKNLDTIGKSDPYAKIFFTDYEGTKIHYFKTATIDEELNPVWEQEDITVHYFPGMVLLVKIFDQDPGRDELEGVCKIPLDELMAEAAVGGDFHSITRPLTVDEDNKRANSVSRVLAPSGISKKDVRGTVSFSFAYASDAMLKEKGQTTVPDDI